MYGLLGKKLQHSFSKEIHENFTNINYSLIEKDDIKSFFKDRNFSGINVTIPYKSDVIKYLDELSTEAKELNSVNTIINVSGKLIGYNTDYYGLDKALSYYDINVYNRDVIILGNGSTSRTIYYYCKRNMANNIIVLARNPRGNEHHFSTVDNYKSTTIVFNATPVGMFPNNNDDIIIQQNLLPNLVSVVDVVYNPLRSNLLIEAENRGIKAINGLFMLISQAVKSIELFHDIQISSTKIEDYYKKLLLKQKNLVYIGMPMSGKTLYAKLTSSIYQKDFIDLDHQVEEEMKMQIPDIFKRYGEKAFRNLETEQVEKHSKLNNKAISCGGGVILNSYNMQLLKQNGIIIFIDFPLEKLKECNPKGRPLLNKPNILEKMFQERYNIYKEHADIIINKENFNKTATLRQIEVKLDEYLNT